MFKRKSGKKQNLNQRLRFLSLLKHSGSYMGTLLPCPPPEHWSLSRAVCTVGRPIEYVTSEEVEMLGKKAIMRRKDVCVGV